MICSSAANVRLVAAVFALGVLGACGSAPPASRSGGPETLTNGLLGPAYSQWLVGAIARMAAPVEINGYLALSDDLAAADAIEAFWRARDSAPEEPGNALRAIYEERALEADRRFSEATYLGRRTARGMIFTLFGQPDTIKYDIALEGGPGIEVWSYPAGAPPGLDGRQPNASYRFRKVGEITTFYRPTVGRQRPGSPVAFGPP